MMQPDTSISLTPNETKLVLSTLGVACALALKIAWAKAKSFEEVAERTRAIDQTLHGDPKASEPNGLVRKLNSVAKKIEEHAGKFEDHVESDERWREEAQRLSTARNNDLQKTLLNIESRLPVKSRRRAAQ